MQHNADFAAAQAERAAVKAHAEAVQPHPMD